MSDHLGVGVMLGMPSGNESSVKAFKGAMGKSIVSLELVADVGLVFAFDDGSKIKLFDNDQSCCEDRYMTTDDQLDYFVGGKLLTAEVREGSTAEGEWGDKHEIAFLVVTTTKGVFTVETHNEHNGYYGGFWVICEEMEAVSND